MQIPRRYSLATQAAAGIREGILDGTWTEVLPGERNLCRFLQISRPTLRAAMDILRHEGLIRVRGRRSTEIVASGIMRRPRDPGAVVLLTGRPLHRQSADKVAFVGELQQALTRSGLRLVIVEDRHLERDHPQRTVDKIIREHKAVCYVLMTVSSAVQVFFSSLRLPAFVRGSRSAGVQLPSSDWDYLAIGRHAAGLLRARGHRRLGLVLPAEIRTGDLRCEEGFRDGGAACGGDVVTLRSAGTSSSLDRRFRRMLAGRERPTGWLVLNPYDCVTVLFSIQALGLRVPGDISVISCETASVLDAVPFRVASYSVNLKLIEKSARLVLKLALNHFLPPHENLIMPGFHAGDTVRSPAQARTKPA